MKLLFLSAVILDRTKPHQNRRLFHSRHLYAQEPEHHGIADGRGIPGRIFRRSQVVPSATTAHPSAGRQDGPGLYGCTQVTDQALQIGKDTLFARVVVGALLPLS